MHSAEHRFSDFRFLMTPLTDFSWDPNEMIKLDLELNNRLSYIVGMNRKKRGIADEFLCEIADAVIGLEIMLHTRSHNWAPTMYLYLIPIRSHILSLLCYPGQGGS